MAAGLPVVASDIAGYREVTRHRSEGLLVAPSDANALAGGVRELLRDPTLALTLGAAGSVRARTFSWSQIIDRIEDAYRSTTSSRDRRPAVDEERQIPVAVGEDIGRAGETWVGRAIDRVRDSALRR
jgi:phosphatidylinositol alpha-mannosyltransferase